MNLPIILATLIAVTTAHTTFLDGLLSPASREILRARQHADARGVASRSMLSEALDVRGGTATSPSRVSVSSLTSALGLRGGASSWTSLTALQSAFLFFLSGLCEIGGGWLIWKTIRDGSQRYSAFIGAALLVLYGFVTTLQPEAAGEEFGRLDAAYGGVFIAMSFLWGRVFDGMKIDAGDIVGGSLCLAGVLVILGYPRSK